MKIWLDDERPMPDGFDVHARTFDEAISFIENNDVELISFDHDLGAEENGTGYDVANWIEAEAYLGMLPKIEWRIHSGNPVGRDNIRRAMENADKYWSRK